MSENSTFHHVADVAAQITPPAEGMVTQTLHHDDALKAIVFGFAAGATLSEHSAPMPVTIQVLQGEVEMSLGGETRQLTAGSWLYLPAQLKHSVRASVPTIMLLSLLKTSPAA